MANIDQGANNFFTRFSNFAKLTGLEWIPGDNQSAILSKFRDLHFEAEINLEFRQNKIIIRFTMLNKDYIGLPKIIFKKTFVPKDFEYVKTKGEFIHIINSPDDIEQFLLMLNSVIELLSTNLREIQNEIGFFINNPQEFYKNAEKYKHYHVAARFPMKNLAINIDKDTFEKVTSIKLDKFDPFLMLIDEKNNDVEITLYKGDLQNGYSITKKNIPRIDFNFKSEVEQFHNESNNLSINSNKFDQPGYLGLDS